MAKKTTGSQRKKLTGNFKKAASNKSKRVHVVPSKDGGWSVKREGSKRASTNTSTKKQAMSAAKNMKSADRVVVHKKNGTIQSQSKIKK